MALLMQQLLLLFCTVTYGGNIDCLAWQSCLGQTKHCVDVTNGEKCVVTCGGPAGSSESCMNTIINCENGVACEVHCNRYKSCYGATINANQATTLTVTTSSIDGEIDLLYNADIYCGNTNFCDITCSNKDNQCYGLYVNAESAGQLVVRCDGDQNNHCQYSQFYCPKTTATCWIFGPAAMHNIDIYSEMGFDAVQLCGIPNTGIEPFGTMHCASGYTQSCNIHQSAPNQCDTTTSTSCHHINPSIDLTCIPPVPTPMPTTTSPTTAIPTTSNPTSGWYFPYQWRPPPTKFTVMECILPNTDPAGCAARKLSIQNAEQNFKFICSNLGACAYSTLNFTYINSMVERVKQISFSEAFAGYNSTIIMDSTQSTRKQYIDKFECKAQGACQGATVQL
eukprot:974124_1